MQQVSKKGGEGSNASVPKTGLQKNEDELSNSSEDFAQQENSLAPATLLVFSHLRWHFVTQRPQHLLSRASRSRTVYFWEEPWFHDSASAPAFVYKGGSLEYLAVEGSPGITVIRPHFFHGDDAIAGQRILLDKFLREVDLARFDRWYYTPMALAFSGHIQAEVTVYDCMDELSAFAGAPVELLDYEKQLFKMADVIFTGGRSIYEAKRTQHHNVHPFPSSIDVQHFAKARSRQMEPEDQVGIPHPRAGFIGVLDERFDAALLADLANLRPLVHFVLIGPIVKIDPARLPQAPNIHYLGIKSYDALPSYLAGWDAALLPFALNEATRFISPTKTPEYLAAGKRVVSTPIHDVVTDYGEAGLVEIAATCEAFAGAVDRAIIGDQDALWTKAVKRKLASSSWDRTWSEMQNEMNTVRERPRLREKSHTRKGKQKPSTMTKVKEEIEYDYIVVGAGFAGSVVAERLASQLGKHVLILDRRPHIGGNTYDFYNEHGILVHQYGPHIFHTSSQMVVDYLSQFTEWRSYEHRVLAHVEGQYLPVPINLDTINRLYGLELDAEGMKTFLAERIEARTEIRNSEDIVVSRVGRDLYEKFFRNYTRKQWGLDPSQLDSSVAGRIPVRFDRDDRYFNDSFQAMPLEGFTRMFERILLDPQITVMLSTDYRDILASHPNAKVVYTGPIDEFFDYRYGPLPYRSLRFEHQTLDTVNFQPAPVVNYPNEHAYTRVTEFKYLTGQQHAKTSIVYEYPTDEGEPYYPIPRPENSLLYEKYRTLAAATKGVYFCGRLANYKYFNMDQVVAQALHLFRTIAEDEAETLTRIEDSPAGAMQTAQSAPAQSVS